VGRQLWPEFAHDVQANGVVRENVVAEAEEEQLARGDRHLRGSRALVHGGSYQWHVAHPDSGAWDWDGI
jgi:hypothetical protein